MTKPIKWFMKFEEFFYREVTDQQMSYFAGQIIDALKNNEPIGRIKGFLYWLLTTTAQSNTSFTNAIPQELRTKFDKTIEQALNFGPQVKISNDGQWLHISFPNLQRPNRLQINDAKVTFKSYFTINLGTNINEVPQYLADFFKKIRTLVPQLYQIFTQNQDSGQIKFPSDIVTILEHPDTLVIHYYQKQTRPAIEQTVRQLFPNQGQRGMRASAGIDIEKDGQKSSHSELVAWAIASELMSYKNKIIQTYTPEMLIPKIKQRVQFWNAKDETSLHNAASQAMS
jgi:hypothetical protein